MFQAILRANFVVKRGGRKEWQVWTPARFGGQKGWQKGMADLATLSDLPPISATRFDHQKGARPNLPPVSATPFDHSE